MKIAIPTKNNVVDDHFGHCEAYTIFTIENGSVQNTEIFPSPAGCGCKSDIAKVLNNKGVTVLLAGNMGGGALNVISAEGIEVMRGNSGNVETLVADYLQGKLQDSGVGCASHEAHHGEGHDDGHVCSHNKPHNGITLDI